MIARVLFTVPVLALWLAAAPGAITHGMEAEDGASHNAGTSAGGDLDPDAALAFSQAALGRTVGDHAFLDRRGRTVRLSEFRGRPLVISLIYTACVHTCPLITQSLDRAVEEAVDTFGAGSFTVATVGFDAANDKPARMRAFATAQGIDRAGWRFLSADHETIDGLSEDIGFIFFRSSQGFDHLAQTTVIDAEGRVYRQIYGETIDLPMLMEPLKDLIYGRNADLTQVEGWVNRIKLFCTYYDPSTDRYRFDYSIFIGAFIGAACLGLILFVILREWLTMRRRGRHA